jgi:hypothetical protein
MKQLKEIIRLTVIKQSPDASRLGLSKSTLLMYCISTMLSTLIILITNVKELAGIA